MQTENSQKENINPIYTKYANENNGYAFPPAPSFLKYMIPNTGQGIMKGALSYITGGRI